MSDYGYTKELNLPYEKAGTMVREALHKEGFEILSKLDVREIFREKLEIGFRKYLILGTCNPPFAYRALQADENAGLLFPCNVILYENGGKTILSIIRPTRTMGAIDNMELRRVATEVERKLKHVFEAVW